MRSFELKLDWAKHQSQAFEDETAAWRALGGYGVVFDKHPKRPGHIIRLKVGDIPPSLPLIIGDALYSLPSSLDHLAHDLASSFTKPLPKEASESSEFPIFWDGAMNAGEKRRKIGAMHPDAQAIVEGLQPHLRGDLYSVDPLWILYELARIDRHRFVHLAVAQFGGIAIGGENVLIEGLETFGFGPSTGNDAELGYVFARPGDPGKPMDMNLTPEPQVVFKDGAFAGREVLRALAIVGEHIETEVVPPLASFLI